LGGKGVQSNRSTVRGRQGKGAPLSSHLQKVRTAAVSGERVSSSRQTPLIVENVRRGGGNGEAFYLYKGRERILCLDVKGSKNAFPLGERKLAVKGENHKKMCLGRKKQSPFLYI